MNDNELIVLTDGNSDDYELTTTLSLAHHLSDEEQEPAVVDPSTTTR